MLVRPSSTHRPTISSSPPPLLRPQQRQRMYVAPGPPNVHPLRPRPDLDTMFPGHGFPVPKSLRQIGHWYASTSDFLAPGPSFAPTPSTNNLSHPLFGF